MPRKSRRTKINFNRKSRRRESTPNVFMDSEDQIGEGVSEDDGAEDGGLSVGSGEAAARESRRRQRAETRALRGRRGRQAPMRAAVYGQYLGAELKKLGMITGALAIALVVLTFTIG
jgi:hypothetical protein